MVKKVKVLVFPCGTEIGLEIHKSLEFSTHFELFGGSSADDHGRFVYANYIGDLPYVDSPNFIDKLNETIAANEIDYVIPAHDSVVLELAKAAAGKKLNCSVLTSPLKTCEIARSKLKTYKLLQSVVATPKIYEKDAITSANFPIFLKPEVGQGSKGTYVANNKDELEFYLKKDSTLLMLEYLPGKEYTVDCFSSNDGKLMFAEGRERIRTLNGISVSTKTVKSETFFEMATQISKLLMFNGVWFFQVKESDSGNYTLLEVAPRIAGTMALVRCKGVNLVLLSLFDAMGYQVEIAENSYKLVIDRALDNKYRHNLEYQHVYIDFDDLIVIDGKVNPQVISFIFQCINKGVKLHLLTRHKQDIHQTLNRYHLDGVFDEIVNIKRPEEEKHSYIKEKEAIFIDDSFAERKKVQDTHGIAVFDSHMIESLMEVF